MELLQNAHDAMENAAPDDPRRVTFVLTTDPKPVLLVGNSGHPFSTDDFYGMCRLGQSPKDPNRSVGNKGLGFRSVLEVSTCPEIWSTAHPDENTAFAFRFDPSISDRVAAVAQQLDQHRFDSRSPFNPELPLVDWSNEHLKQYHNRMAATSVKGSDEAKQYLSPYLFPIPIEGDFSEVIGLLCTGHVTVIRLPLDGGRTGTSEVAVQSVKDQLEELDARSTIFLSQLRELEIDINGEKRVLERVVDSDVLISDSQGTRQERLLVGCSGLNPQDNTTSLFHLWSRNFGGNNDLKQEKRIRASVRHLPNRWPEVRRVSVGIAVEEAPNPVEGVFVIFLPSEMATGTGTHVNAPFYGSVDRRHINFDDAYNRLLLEYVLDLCIDTVTGLILEEPEGWRAKAVIDVLSSTATVGGQNWRFLDRLLERALEREITLDRHSLVLCDDGWRLPGDARLMPDIPDDDLIGTARWRQHAAFAVVESILNGRRAGVEALLEKLNCALRPMPDEWCRTIEQIAKKVRASNIDLTWDNFFRSIITVLPNDLRSGPSPWTDDPDPLLDARFLPTQDGRILNASDPIKLFFQPVRGIDDVAELVEAVPESVSDRVAFLHHDIRTREKNPQGRNTPIQEFLNRRFVQTFEREELLRVVLDSMPALPAYHGTPQSELCAELFVWITKILGQEELDSSLSLIRQLPVACHGGWLAMNDATFGPGWPNRLGDLVWSLGAELPRDAAMRLCQSTLLPPDDQRWRVPVRWLGDLFERAGVFDGIRLQQVPAVRFRMSSYSHELPDVPPAGIPRTAWDEWRDAARNEAKPPFISEFEYELLDVQLLPEIHYLPELNQSGKKILSDLVLASLGSWTGWETVTISKTSRNYREWHVTSPLECWLKTLGWLSDGPETKQPLGRRWLVPESLLRGQRFRYSYLNPLSLDLAHRLNNEPDLKTSLIRLDLNVYPTEDEQTGPELLDALAKAWAANKVNADQFDMFLGQVRDAWQHLDREKGLPDIFLVRTAKRTFETRGLDKLADVYLPDSRDRTRSLQEYGKHVLEMHTSDARRLASTLLAETSIRRASLLKERFLIDDELWTDVIEGIPAIDETKFTWLPVTLLTIAAQGGNSPMGTTTATWNEAADRLRRTRVLECETIDVQLVHEAQLVASDKPVAHWLTADVLAIRRDMELEYESLAPAAQAMLRRQDVSKDLRLVLGALANCEEPTHEQIVEALERAEIDSEMFADIRNRWAGNISLIVDRIRPVLTLLKVPPDGLDAEANDIDHLKEWLSSNLTPWSAQQMLSAAQRSRDENEMGKAAWCALGDVAQLPEWNAVLSTFGDRYVTATNSHVDEQTNAHLEEATPLLRALARHVAVKAENPDLFLKLEDKHQSFKADADWLTRWWEVPFVAIIDKLRVDYTEIISDDSHLEVLQGAKSIDDLRTAFHRNGIAVDPDPYDIAGMNQKSLNDLLLSVHDLYRTWLELGRSSSKQIEPPVPVVNLDPSAYLSRWSEHEILERAFEIIDDESFNKTCEGCKSLHEVQQRHKLTVEKAATRGQERIQRKRDTERRQRTIEVAGARFEVGMDNYNDLFERLNDLADPEGPEASRDEITPLVETSESRGSRASGRKANKVPISQSPDNRHLRELAGVVGEIHAYRFLRAEFGKDVVTRDKWLSKIRLDVLPLVDGEPDRTSDSHGFDFKFRYRRRNWHIEVKSTVGDESLFKLGISEINAATQFAQRRVIWRVLRVRNVLSDRPQFEWLPNPFEKESRKLFRLHEAEMTVHYTRKTD